MNRTLIAIAAGAILVITLVGVGYRARGDHDAAKQVKQVIAEQKQTAAQIVESTKISQDVASTVEAMTEAVDTNKKAAHERVVAQIHPISIHNSEKTNEEEPAKTCGPAYLDVGTVRLLNAARAGSTLGAAAGSDVASTAGAAATDSR